MVDNSENKNGQKNAGNDTGSANGKEPFKEIPDRMRIFSSRPARNCGFACVIRSHVSEMPCDVGPGVLIVCQSAARIAVM